MQERLAKTRRQIVAFWIIAGGMLVGGNELCAQISLSPSIPGLRSTAPARPTAPAATTTPASPTTPADAVEQVQPRIKQPVVALPQAIAENRSGLKITKGTGVLPNDYGQVWREYDITPYTSQVKEGAKPEQAIVDWILRETGTDVWFAEPLGILNADSRRLRVYHTPEMQQIVRDVVERFVASDSEPQVLGLRLMTIGSPNWRSAAVQMLKPVDVQSPGIEAWLLSRENAAALLGSLRTRADFRDHSSPNLQIFNGQSQAVTRTQPRNYVRGVKLTGTFPGYEMTPGRIDEGYSLQISPLMSLDGKTCDAAIKCNVDQIEKFVSVSLDIPLGTQSQRAQIQVPQLVSWRLSERFRWPTDQVLLLSCGIVASPAPDGGAGPLSFVNPFATSGSRVDALLMIECKGRLSQSVVGVAPADAASAASTSATNFGVMTIPNVSTAPKYHGRY
jgi:hypothetical protein